MIGILHYENEILHATLKILNAYGNDSVFKSDTIECNLDYLWRLVYYSSCVWYGTRVFYKKNIQNIVIMNSVWLWSKMNPHNPFLHYIKNKDGTGLGIPSDSNSWYRKNVIRNQILFPYLYSLPLLVLFEAVPCGVTQLPNPKERRRRKQLRYILFVICRKVGLLCNRSLRCHTTLPLSLGRALRDIRKNSEEGDYKNQGYVPPLPSPVCTVVLSSFGVEFVIVDVVWGVVLISFAVVVISTVVVAEVKADIVAISTEVVAEVKADTVVYLVALWTYAVVGTVVGLEGQHLQTQVFLQFFTRSAAMDDVQQFPTLLLQYWSL